MAVITIALVTPQKTLYEGKATWIQVPAMDGYMGFLAQHAPLVSILGTGILTFTEEGGTNRFFALSGGYFEIHEDAMIILADNAEPGMTIDVERAEKSRERAIERITGQSDGNYDLDRAKASLMRALTRIKASQLSHHTGKQN